MNLEFRKVAKSGRKWFDERRFTRSGCEQSDHLRESAFDGMHEPRVVVPRRTWDGRPAEIHVLLNTHMCQISRSGSGRGSSWGGWWGRWRSMSTVAICTRVCSVQKIRSSPSGRPCHVCCVCECVQPARYARRI